MLSLKVFKEGTGINWNRRKENWRTEKLWKETDWLCIGFKYSYFEVEDKVRKDALLKEGKTYVRIRSKTFDFPFFFSF